MSDGCEPQLSKFQRIGSISVTRSSLKQRVFSIEQQSNIVCAVHARLQADPDITDEYPLQGYLVWRMAHILTQEVNDM